MELEGSEDGQERGEASELDADAQFEMDDKAREEEHEHLLYEEAVQREAIANMHSAAKAFVAQVACFMVVRWAFYAGWTLGLVNYFRPVYVGL